MAVRVFMITGRDRETSLRGQTMNIRQSTSSLFLATIATAALIAANSPASAFGRSDLVCVQQENAVSASEGSQSLLARIRTECPLLGNIVEEFALQDLGEVFPSEGQKFRSREIVAAIAFAASGDTASMKRSAKDALDAGATEFEFKKLLYLTAVNAGAPRAIEATRALADVFGEREVCSHRSARAEVPQF
jgi:alkylhydroperoxidase/carboxymuconolactone decarboxylase family protein YurZ